MARKVKGFGRLRTKASHAGTRDSSRLPYGDLCFRLVGRDKRGTLMDAQQRRNGRCWDAPEACSRLLPL